jgi:hypothetical protein
MMRTAEISKAVLILSVAGAALAWLLFTAPSAADAERYAADIVEHCRDEEPGACYEREVPELLDKLSLEQVFEVVRAVRRADPTYQFCHVLAHKMGERTVAEDPERWVEVMAYNPPDGLCSNGYVHGVVGGRFRAEVLTPETLTTLVPDFSRACEPRAGWQPSSLEQAMCYHGMGHLYMFITDAQIGDALHLCEQTADSTTGDFRRVCREGVFMQIYQPLEPDDFLLIEQMKEKPVKETVRSFCARYPKDEYEGACLRESWPYFRAEIFEQGGVQNFCSGQPNKEEETACYQSTAGIVGRMSLGEPERIVAVCNTFPQEYWLMCYATAANTFIEEDRSAAQKTITLCQHAPAEVASQCLEAVASTAWYVFGGDSRRLKSFCAQLPPEHRAACIQP